MFELEGYTADYATTAKEAFQKINEHQYDLLFVDIKLEGKVSGIDIIKSFKEMSKRPAIVVISAIPLDSLDPVFLKEGIKYLIDGFGDKPGCCDPQKLIGLAQRALSKNQG